MTRSELIEVWKARPISWSQLSSWKFRKEQWRDKYLFGLREDANPDMLFGNVVGDSLGTESSQVPSLNPHLVGVKEFELKAKLNGLTLIGYADHYCPDTKVLNENKTSRKLDRWTQTEVDLHGQLTMYATMLMLTHKTKPDDIEMWLNFIPVQEGGDFQLSIIDPTLYHRFPTKRTMKQCLDFGTSIGKTLKEMEKYALAVDIPTCIPA